MYEKIEKLQAQAEDIERQIHEREREQWPPHRMNPAKKGARTSVGLDWQWAKQERRDIRGKEKKIRATRDAALKGTSAGCAFKRKDVTAWCQKRRKQIRDEARKKLDKTKRRRAEVNRAAGRVKPETATRKKMSKAESDSLAEHNVEPRHVKLWREVRHLFPYADAPDKRAELFGEWLEEHPSEVYAWEQAREEETDYGAEEAEYYRQMAS